MMIEKMKGSQRQLLLKACDDFAKATKTAQRNTEAAFLPTMDADAQAERITEAKDRVPPFDDVARSWEAPEPLNFAYRNAIVVSARLVDKVREKEKERTILTSDSDAVIEEMQTMLEILGDQRNLESVLKTSRNTEAVEKDQNQLDLVDAIS